MDTMNKATDYSSICRICLKKDLPLNCLFETEAGKMLIYCGFLEIVEDDNLPQNICTSCFNALEDAYKLKQLCDSSVQFFQNLLTCNSEVYEKEVERTHLEEPFLGDCETQSSQIVLAEPDQSNKECGYKCTGCKSEFKTERDLVVHQSIHATELKCNACDKLFHSMKILKRHLKTHMTKFHTCNVCHKSFVESWDVIRHSKQHHLGIPREKKYKCRECNQSFTDQYYLNVHQRKHSGEKPLQCRECQKAFYDPRSLKTHINSHKGVKPYLCNFCGKSFLQNAHLRQHIVVHDRKKPFSCTYCDKQFTQAASLLRHQKMHKER